VATLGWIDILIILAFVVYSVSSGIRSSKVASQNLEEYFLAGRSLSGWSAGLSMAATQFAADTPLLVTGLVATAGIFALWQLWIYALSFLLMGFILAPSWRRASVLTDAELTELRYGSGAATALRGIKAIYFGTIFNCVVLAWVLFATKAIAEPFLVWDQWLPAALYQPMLRLVTWIDVPLSVNPADAHVWIMSTNNLISISVAWVQLSSRSVTATPQEALEGSPPTRSSPLSRLRPKTPHSPSWPCSPCSG
jgi:pimeloyl-ACP methyl ester carboxylesterase